MHNRTFAGASVGALRSSFAAVLVLACGMTCAHAKSQKPLTMDEALSRAIAADVGAAASRARAQGGEAGIRQANRNLNPSVGLDMENFGGSGQYRGFGQPETTLYLQQTIELGDKRAARTGVARSERDKVQAQGAVRKLDLVREVELAWIEVLVATAQQRVAEDKLSIARQFQQEIVRRSTAGKDPLFTQTQAEAQVSLEEIAVEQAKEATRIARASLAAYWRGSPDFSVDLKAFESAVATPSDKADSADLAVLEADHEVASAKVGLERSRAIQDPAVRVGVRHFNDTSDTALVAGIAIPLPVNDNNADNIEKAEAERRAAEIDLQSARIAIQRELTRLRARLAASAKEARRIQREVIPRAEKAILLVREGFQRGAFTYVEFTEALRTLNDARLRRIEALRSFHQDNALVSRLTGRHARRNKG